VTLEHKHQKLLGKRQFAKRLIRYISVALIIILGSLGVGMYGYHSWGELSWIDAFLNAAMILGGMGQVDEIHSVAGKLFAGIFALFGGIVFIVVAGLLFAPLMHRILHRLHVGD
jgi:hypothetical protein